MRKNAGVFVGRSVEAAVADLLQMLPLTPAAARGPSDRLVSYLLGWNAPETTTTATLPPATDETMTTTTATLRIRLDGGDARHLWRAECVGGAAWDV